MIRSVYAYRTHTRITYRGTRQTQSRNRSAARNGQKARTSRRNWRSKTSKETQRCYVRRSASSSIRTDESILGETQKTSRQKALGWLFAASKLFAILERLPAIVAVTTTAAIATAVSTATAAARCTIRLRTRFVDV